MHKTRHNEDARTTDPGILHKTHAAPTHMPDFLLATHRQRWRDRLLAFRGSTHVRYVLVGGFNTIFGYAAFIAFNAVLGRESHYLVVLLFAHLLSVLVAFVGYRVIVFQARGYLLTDLLRFWSVYASVFVANLFCLPLFVEGLGAPVVPAQGVFTTATVAVSFIAHRRFSFKRPDTAPSE